MSTRNDVLKVQNLVTSALEKTVTIINRKDYIIKNLEEHINTLSKNNYEYKNAELTKERDNLKNNVLNLANKVDDHDNQIANIHAAYKKELDDKNLTIENLRTFNTKSTIKIQKLSSDCIVLKEQNSKKAETIRRMSAEFNSMSIAKSALDVEIQRLETKKQAEIDELKIDLSQLTKKYLETIRQSTDHRLRHEKCAASNQFLQEDYVTLKEHSTKLENEIKDLKAKLDNITSLLD